MPAKITTNTDGRFCQVTGIYRTPDNSMGAGEIEFFPMTGGADPVSGIIYSTDAVKVFADANTGRWSILLAPSSIVGRYTVRLGAMKIYATVPDDESAEFTEIVEAKR